MKTLSKVLTVLSLVGISFISLANQDQNRENSSIGDINQKADCTIDNEGYPICKIQPGQFYDPPSDIDQK
ncbi:hypothetical protein [Arsenophonus apicola]|uniref:Uncharacterized protein n=1 Tax=Arsenophonus apicola TaxID=2879119 RepID=A0ABY8P3X1_9GAMM|nr:hypothetical protein [Arsenophonus apicola]WGO84190.1 hypothetical protein QG404_04665 [Arsenophonus apicola]